MDSCICHYDAADYGPEVCTETIVKAARKEHVCIECQEPIPIGASYERVEGLWEGRWETFKTCIPCMRIRKDMFPCGWIYGQMREDILGYLEFDYVTGRWLEEALRAPKLAMKGSVQSLTDPRKHGVPVASSEPEGPATVVRPR